MDLTTRTQVPNFVGNAEIAFAFYSNVFLHRLKGFVKVLLQILWIWGGKPDGFASSKVPQPSIRHRKGPTRHLFRQTRCGW